MKDEIWAFTKWIKNELTADRLGPRTQVKLPSPMEDVRLKKETQNNYIVIYGILIITCKRTKLLSRKYHILT